REGKEAVQGGITGAAAKDEELAPVRIDRTTDQWMGREELEPFQDDGNGLDGRGGIGFPKEQREPLEVSERRAREPERCHSASGLLADLDGCWPARLRARGDSQDVTLDVFHRIGDAGALVLAQRVRAS